MKHNNLIVFLFGVIVCMTSCVNQNNSDKQQKQNSQSANVYDKEIDELEKLVGSIVSLEYQYMQTGDEDIAEQGEALCSKLREKAYRIENYQNEGKL